MVAQKFSVSLMLFRRDLRLEDNTALRMAAEQSETVLPCFIFDPLQVQKHDYFSNNAFEFMLNSLEELDAALRKKGSRLYCFKGDPISVIKKLAKQVGAQALLFNKDYTPFARKRDTKLDSLASKDFQVQSFDDALLNAPGQVLKADKNPYTVYSAFARKARELHVARAKKTTLKKLYPQNCAGETSVTAIRRQYLKASNPQLRVKGGRKEALKLLVKVSSFKQYKTQRDFPAVQGTSLLSAHHKFGTVSIREVYWKIADSFSKQHQLIAELYWRDFFTHIAYFFPHVFKGAFRTKYNTLKWSSSTKNFKAWCEGRTGFPIVDAGMRELNATGYMHNRVRMIVASFLVKDLHCNWQKGEKYFATKLVDYDPSVNNGNWQWAASTGCDAQPYFRIFNPWRQQQRFDPNCEYIKQWVPELKNLSAKEIHGLEKGLPEGLEYPAQLVGHKEVAAQAKAMFQAIK